jgi:Protein of unknown function
VQDEIAKLVVVGALGAVSAAAAHRNIAIYHDGLRTSVADITSGLKTRREMAAYAYTISIGFVVAYALPFALASGILIIHMIMLGTDVIGVRCRRTAGSIAAGFAWGVFVVGAVDLFVKGVQHLPLATTGRDLLWMPLVFSLPLLGASTAAQAHGFRAGVIATLATAAVWGASYAVWKAADSGSATTFGSGLIAFAVVLVALVIVAFRERAEEETDLSMFDDNIRRIRGNWPYLLPIAGLIAVTASSGWMGGEPVQVALVSSGHLEGAALVAVFSSIGFVPLQGMTGLVSGVWNQHGYPDWFLGAGYLTGNRAIAAVAGAALMGIELLTLRRVAWVLTARPGVTTLGSAARESLEIVPTLAMLAGGVLAATAVAGPVGAFTVIAVFYLNDKRGRPVMPIAAPVIGYLLVLVATGLAHKAGVFT